MNDRRLRGGDDTREQNSAYGPFDQRPRFGGVVAFGARASASGRGLATPWYPPSARMLAGTIRCLCYSTLALALAWPALARGDEVWVRADSTMQIYDVGTPASTLRWERRRFVQTLVGRYARRLLVDQEPRLEVVADVRIEQDFDRDCDPTLERCFPVTDSERPFDYNPLAVDSSLEARALYVRVSGLPVGGSAQLGRQLILGPIAMFRLDGLSAGVAPYDWLSLSVYGGQRVRSFSWWGTDTFAPSGSLRLRLESGRAVEEIDFVAPPLTAWVVGGSLRLLPVRWARAELSFREVWDRDGLVERRGGLRFRWSLRSWLRLSAQGVAELTSLSLVHAASRIELDIDRVTFDLGVQRRRSAYDLGTIWAYFQAAPVDEVVVGARRRSRSLSFGAGLRGRRIDRGDESDHEIGVEAFGELRRGGWIVHLDGDFFAGDLGPLFSFSSGVERRFLDALDLRLGLSFWHFDDPMRSTLRGPSVAETLSGRLEISPVTHIGLDMQHSYNYLAGHRLRALGQLSVEVWR